MKGIFAGGALMLAFWIAYIVTAFAGLIYTFQASLVLGIVGLFTGGGFWFIEALCKWFAHYDVALAIAKALGLP